VHPISAGVLLAREIPIVIGDATMGIAQVTTALPFLTGRHRLERRVRNLRNDTPSPRS
jgi:hypothetical protein